MQTKSFIGVDLHTNRFTACYLKKNKEASYCTYELTPEGLDDFFSNLNKKDEVAVEATANSSFFHKQLKGKVKKITLVAPSQFSIIGKSVNKSDLVDSYKLALFLSKNLLPKARLKPEAYVQLGSLVDTRASLVRMKSALIRKAHAILIRNGCKIPRNRLATKSGFERYIFSKEWPKFAQIELAIIYEQIKSLEVNISELDKNIRNLGEKLYGYKNLLSIKGIGELSAATLLAVIGEVEDFEKPSNLSSYFGIVPKMQQSNESIKMGRITKAGSKSGRTALIQCTWVAIKFSPYLKSYFERIKARGNSKKAIVACSRKMLSTIFYTLKNDWVFDDFTKYEYHIRTDE